MSQIEKSGKSNFEEGRTLMIDVIAFKTRIHDEKASRWAQDLRIRMGNLDGISALKHSPSNVDCLVHTHGTEPPITRTNSNQECETHWEAKVIYCTEDNVNN